MDYKYLSRVPIKLIKNRVYRPFLGGKSIDEWEGKSICEDNHYGERWIASLVDVRSKERKDDEGLSKLVIDGIEITLKEVIESSPEDFLGMEHCRKYGTSLAILVKALDAFSRLIIQVHPNKEMARQLFDSPFGKTEAWYIIGGRKIDGKEPYILIGFKEGINKEDYKRLFQLQDIKALEDTMHKIPVKEGDVYLIEGGVPHAIGAGCFLIEIQEPTDYTIRVEKSAPDGRKIDDFSCHQGVGFDRMFDCFNYEGLSRDKVIDRYKLTPKILLDIEDATVISLIGEEDTDLFSMEKILVRKTLSFNKKDNFAVAAVLKGNGKLLCNGEELDLNQGDEVFLPYEAKEITWVNEGSEELELIVCLPPN